MTYRGGMALQPGLAGGRAFQPLSRYGIYVRADARRLS